jgi:putative tricarboxylic transport membrane protein
MIRTADLVTASVLMLVGAIVVFDSLRLGIGWGSDGPKSGFFPFWLGVILLGTCVAIVIQAVRRAERKPFITREQIGPVLKVLAPATALVVIMQFVGLYVASALYIGVYMRWIGRHSWLAVIGLAVGIPVATFLVFERWFLVPMPKGPLEAWLGF